MADEVKDQNQEPANEPEQQNPESNSEPEQNQEPQISLEEEISQLKAEMAKLRRDKDSASTDAANWKKKYNATLTDAQRAAQEKAEKDAALQAEVETLRKKDKVNDLTANYLDLGYSKDKAKEAATAQYDNDTDTLLRLQEEHQKELLKKAEQDWIKSRPEVNTGAGDGTEKDPFLEGFNSVGSPFKVAKN